jgi:hypothetical protein
MRVRFSSLRCFFFAIRLRRFLMTEPTDLALSTSRDEGPEINSQLPPGRSPRRIRDPTRPRDSTGIEACGAAGAGAVGGLANDDGPARPARPGGQMRLAYERGQRAFARPGWQVKLHPARTGTTRTTGLANEAGFGPNRHHTDDRADVCGRAGGWVSLGRKGSGRPAALAIARIPSMQSGRGGRSPTR